MKVRLIRVKDAGASVAEIGKNGAIGVPVVTKDYQHMAEDVNASSAALSLGLPEAMRGFKLLGRGAYADGALTRKTKEIIALVLSVASRCDGCVAYHARRLFELDASREELLEAIGVAVQMGGGPSMVYGGEALRAFDAFQNQAIAAE